MYADAVFVLIGNIRNGKINDILTIIQLKLVIMYFEFLCVPKKLLRYYILCKLCIGNSYCSCTLSISAIRPLVGLLVDV